MIQQGHLYEYHGSKVLAMESGPSWGGLVSVRRLGNEPMTGLGPAFLAPAELLRPLPMRYHGNCIPGAK